MDLSGGGGPRLGVGAARLHALGCRPCGTRRTPRPLRLRRRAPGCAVTAPHSIDARCALADGGRPHRVPRRGRRHPPVARHPRVGGLGLARPLGWGSRGRPCRRLPRCTSSGCGRVRAPAPGPGGHRGRAPRRGPARRPSRPRARLPALAVQPRRGHRARPGRPGLAGGRPSRARASGPRADPRERPGRRRARGARLARSPLRDAGERGGRRRTRA